MDGFTFYKSFYETMKKIRKRTDREKISLAIIEFMFEETEPKNLSESCEIAFESFRRTLEISRARGNSAIKSNRNQNEIKTKSNEIKNNTNEINDETSSSLSLSLSVTPPLYPPPSHKCEVEEGKDFKKLFFEKYPALKCKKPKDDGINYSVLLTEFEKSATLRGMYSFSKVVGMYESIKAGTYRDKVDEHIAAVNAKSAREKWYAERQAKAESVAYAYQKKAKENKRFFAVDNELRRLNMELAKAEVSGSDMYLGLKEYQERLLEERCTILKKLGIEEWQLLPQYECKKCSDSGFLPDGRACDCYKGG